MDVNIRIAGIINESIVDGPGIRMVVLHRAADINVPAAITQRLILLMEESW